MTDIKHPLDWRDTYRGVNVPSHEHGVNPFHVSVKRPDGRWCTLASLNTMRWTSARVYQALDPNDDPRPYWRRCMFWSVPIVELTDKLLNGTASAAEVDNLKQYIARAKG